MCVVEVWFCVSGNFGEGYSRVVWELRRSIFIFFLVFNFNIVWPLVNQGKGYYYVFNFPENKCRIFQMKNEL